MKKGHLLSKMKNLFLHQIGQHVFHCFYSNKKLNKFDSQECIMLRYIEWSKGYKASNPETKIENESTHV